MSDERESAAPTGAEHERHMALAEAHARKICTVSTIPLAVVFVTLFLPAMTFFHESGLPIFMLPLPFALVWPVPVYLAAFALCLVIVAERQGSRGGPSRLLTALLLLSIVADGLIMLFILLPHGIDGLGLALAAPFAAGLALGAAALLFARRHRGMRRAAFLLLSYSISTAPFGVVLVVLMDDRHARLRWGGYITFVALIVILLLASVAVLPPSVLSRYREPKR